MAELELSGTPGKYSASFTALSEPSSCGVAPQLMPWSCWPGECHLPQGRPESCLGDALEMRNVGAHSPIFWPHFPVSSPCNYGLMAGGSSEKHASDLLFRGGSARSLLAFPCLERLFQGRRAMLTGLRGDTWRQKGARKTISQPQASRFQ